MADNLDVIRYMSNKKQMNDTLPGDFLELFRKARESSPVHFAYIIITSYMGLENYSEDVARKFTEWFFNGYNQEVKEIALERIFNEILSEEEDSRSADTLFSKKLMN